MTFRSLAVFVFCGVVYAQTPLVVASSQSKGAAQRQKKPAPPEIRYVESGSGVVAVNPAQPYRPIPAGAKAPKETIFAFYLRVLNPHQINWGAEIDRRLAILSEQSIGNPYFRLCAFLVAAVLFLTTLCWAWWDKDAANQIGCGRVFDGHAQR